MKLQKLISETLHKAQEDMPPGQNRIVHSKAACDALAEKVCKAICEQTVDNRLFAELEVERYSRLHGNGNPYHQREPGIDY